MPLSLRMGPRQWTILHNIATGGQDWEDLTFEQKMMAYRTGIDLTDTVDPGKIQSFEKKLEVHERMQESGLVGTAVNKARLALM